MPSTPTLSRMLSSLVPRAQVRAGLVCASLGTSKRTSVAHSPPIICIPSSSLHPLRTKAKTGSLHPIVILPTSSIPSKETISQVQVFPEIRPASHQKRSPREHIDEDSSSGSDGGEEYSSTHVGEYFRDEEGLRLGSEETWEMISI